MRLEISLESYNLGGCTIIWGWGWVRNTNYENTALIYSICVCICSICTYAGGNFCNKPNEYFVMCVRTQEVSLWRTNSEWIRPPIVHSSFMMTRAHFSRKSFYPAFRLDITLFTHIFIILLYFMYFIDLYI